MSTLTSEDEGKVLVDREGEQLGVVTTVENGTAYVDPDPNVAEATLEALGLSSGHADDIKVPPAAVDTVTDQEIRVHEDL